uniref:Armadillo/beta-catenin-like repeat-containing protein, putative n=1 Tax=Neospora caninum (strain Liverpool) TaxID=572307 RepID=A0A0F7U362_NEOCL|nr:TPA: armadillo/beta-catenin-like repeat-containing protein, putative [Neospora caninum Liverpool]
MARHCAKRGLAARKCASSPHHHEGEEEQEEGEEGFQGNGDAPLEDKAATDAVEVRTNGVDLQGRLEADSRAASFSACEARDTARTGDAFACVVKAYPKETAESDAKAGRRQPSAGGASRREWSCDRERHSSGGTTAVNETLLASPRRSGDDGEDVRQDRQARKQPDVLGAAGRDEGTRLTCETAREEEIRGQREGREGRGTRSERAGRGENSTEDEAGGRRGEEDFEGEQRPQDAGTGSPLEIGCCTGDSEDGQQGDEAGGTGMGKGPSEQRGGEDEQRVPGGEEGARTEETAELKDGATEDEGSAAVERTGTPSACEDRAESRFGKVGDSTACDNCGPREKAEEEGDEPEERSVRTWIGKKWESGAVKAVAQICKRRQLDPQASFLSASVESSDEQEDGSEEEEKGEGFEEGDDDGEAGEEEEEESGAAEGEEESFSSEVLRCREAPCFTPRNEARVVGSVPGRSALPRSLEMFLLEGEVSSLSSPRAGRSETNRAGSQGEASDRLCVLSSFSSMEALLRVTQKLPFESLVAFCCEYLRQLNAHLRFVRDLSLRQEKAYLALIARSRLPTNFSLAASSRPSSSPSPPSSPSSPSSPPLSSGSSSPSFLPTCVSPREKRSRGRRHSVSVCPGEETGTADEHRAAGNAREGEPSRQPRAADGGAFEEGSRFSFTRAYALRDANRLSRVSCVQRCCQECTEPVLQLLSCAYLVRLFCWREEERDRAFPVHPETLVTLIRALSLHRQHLVRLHRVHFPSLDLALLALSRLYAQSVALFQVLPVFRGLLRSEFTGSVSLVLHVRSPFPLLPGKDTPMHARAGAQASPEARGRRRQVATDSRPSDCFARCSGSQFFQTPSGSGDAWGIGRSSSASLGSSCVSACAASSSFLWRPVAVSSWLGLSFFSRPSRLERSRAAACIRARDAAHEALQALASFRRAPEVNRGFSVNLSRTGLDRPHSSSVPVPCSFSLATWSPAVLSRLLMRLLHAGGVSSVSAAGPSGRSSTFGDSGVSAPPPCVRGARSFSPSTADRPHAGPRQTGAESPTDTSRSWREERFALQSSPLVSRVALQLCRAVLFSFHAALRKFMLDGDVSLTDAPAVLPLTVQQAEAGAFAHARVAAEMARHFSEIAQLVSEGRERQASPRSEEDETRSSRFLLADREACAKAAQALADAAEGAASAVRRSAQANGASAPSFFPNSFFSGGGSLEPGTQRHAAGRACAANESFFFLGKAYAWRDQTRAGAAGPDGSNLATDVSRREESGEKEREREEGWRQGRPDRTHAQRARAIQLACDEEDLLCAQLNALTQLVLFCAQVETPLAALASADSGRRQRATVGRRYTAEREENPHCESEGCLREERRLCGLRARGERRTSNSEGETDSKLHAGAWTDEEPKRASESQYLAMQNGGRPENAKMWRRDTEQASRSSPSLSEAEADDEGVEEDDEKSAESMSWREELGTGFAREARRFATLAQELKDRLVGLITAEAVHLIRSHPYVPALPLTSVFASLLSPSRVDGTPSLLSASLRLLPQCRAAVWEASMARVGESLVHAVLHTRLLPLRFASLAARVLSLNRATDPPAESAAELPDVFLTSPGHTRKFPRALARFLSTARVLLLAYCSAPLVFDAPSGPAASSACSRIDGQGRSGRCSPSALAVHRSVSFLRDLEAFLRAPAAAIDAPLSQMVERRFPCFASALSPPRPRSNDEPARRSSSPQVSPRPALEARRRPTAASVEARSLEPSGKEDSDSRAGRPASSWAFQSVSARPSASGDRLAEGGRGAAGGLASEDGGVPGQVAGRWRQSMLVEEERTGRISVSLRTAEDYEKAVRVVEAFLQCGVKAEKFAADLLRLRPDLPRASKEGALAEICEKLARARRQAAQALAEARRAVEARRGRGDGSGEAEWGPMSEEAACDERAGTPRHEETYSQRNDACGRFRGERRQAVRAELAGDGNGTAQGGDRGWGVEEKILERLRKSSCGGAKETAKQRVAESDGEELQLKATTAEREGRTQGTENDATQKKKAQCTKQMMERGAREEARGRRGEERGLGGASALEEGAKEDKRFRDSPQVCRTGEAASAKSLFSTDSDSVASGLSKETLPFDWPGKAASSLASPCCLSVASPTQLASLSTAAALPSLLSTVPVPLASEGTEMLFLEADSAFGDTTAFSSAPSSFCSSSNLSSSHSSSLAPTAASSATFSSVCPLSSGTAGGFSPSPACRSGASPAPAAQEGTRPRRPCGGSQRRVDAQRGSETWNQRSDLGGRQGDAPPFRRAGLPIGGANGQGKERAEEGPAPESLSPLAGNASPQVSLSVHSDAPSPRIAPSLSAASACCQAVPLGLPVCEAAGAGVFSQRSSQAGERNASLPPSARNRRGAPEPDFVRLLDGARESLGGRARAFPQAGSLRSFRPEEERTCGASATFSAFPLLAAVARGLRENSGMPGISSSLPDSEVDSHTDSESDDDARARGQEQTSRDSLLGSEIMATGDNWESKGFCEKRGNLCVPQWSARRRPRRVDASRRHGGRGGPPAGRENVGFSRKKERQKDWREPKGEHALAGFVWQRGHLPPGASRFFPSPFTAFFSSVLTQSEDCDSFAQALSRLLASLVGEPARRPEDPQRRADSLGASERRETGERLRALPCEKGGSEAVRKWWRIQGSLLTIAASPAEIFAEASIYVGDLCCVLGDREESEETGEDAEKTCRGCGLGHVEKEDGEGSEGGDGSLRGIWREKARPGRGANVMDDEEIEGEEGFPAEGKTLWHDLDYEWIDADETTLRDPRCRLILTFWDGVRSPLHVFFSSPRRRRLWAQTLRAAIARASSHLRERGVGEDSSVSSFSSSSRSSSSSSRSSCPSSRSRSFSSPSSRHSSVPSAPSTASPSLGSVRRRRGSKPKGAGPFRIRHRKGGRDSSSCLELPHLPTACSQFPGPCFLVYSEHPHVVHSGTTVYFPSPALFSSVMSSRFSGFLSEGRSGSAHHSVSPVGRLSPPSPSQTLREGVFSLLGASGQEASRSAVSEGLSRFRNLLGVSVPGDACASVPLETPHPREKRGDFSWLWARRGRAGRPSATKRTREEHSGQAPSPPWGRWDEADKRRGERKTGDLVKHEDRGVGEGGGTRSEERQRRPTLDDSLSSWPQRQTNGATLQSCRRIPRHARPETDAAALPSALRLNDLALVNQLENAPWSDPEREWCFPEEVCLSVEAPRGRPRSPSFMPSSSVFGIVGL